MDKLLKRRLYKKVLKIVESYEEDDSNEDGPFMTGTISCFYFGFLADKLLKSGLVKKTKDEILHILYEFEYFEIHDNKPFRYGYVDDFEGIAKKLIK